MLREDSLIKGFTLAAAAWLGVVAPAWSFEGIRLTLLGTGNVASDRAQPALSTLVEAGDEVLLVDCGPGTGERLLRAGVQSSELTGIFLTGLSPELVDGCRELWRAARDAGRQAPAIWGPRGTRALFEEIERERGRDETANGVHDLADNVVYRSDGVTVTAFVSDAVAPAQRFGYRIDAYRRSATLSGHTRYSENLIRNARGTHVLVHEVAAASAQAAQAQPVRDALADHTSPEEAARVFGAVRPYLALFAPALLFGVDEQELVRRTRRGYRGPLEVARDAMVIEIQNEVQLRGSPSDGPRALR